MGQQLHADDRPIVIAHRGASGYRPEHTILSYRMGIAQGADFIEPDLVMTRDGHLVARHDAYLSDSTDIAGHPEFADRRREFQGRTDWWVFDFTLAEIRTLRARQARPERGTEYDGQALIPTVEEIIALVEAEAPGGQVGLYIEIKHPMEHKAMGLDPTDGLIAAFDALKEKGIPAYFQCFSGEYLKQTANKIQAPLIWLIEGVENPETGRYELDVELDRYGDILAGIGPYKMLLADAEGRSTGIVEEAHRLGYLVHPWTYRVDQLGDGFKDMESELDFYWKLGVDGVFTDFPDVGVASRDRYMKR